MIKRDRTLGKEVFMTDEQIKNREKVESADRKAKLENTEATEFMDELENL